MFLHYEYETLLLACISCKLGLYALNLLRRGHIYNNWLIHIYISMDQMHKRIGVLDPNPFHFVRGANIYILHWNLHQRWSRAPQPCKGTAHLETNILGMLGPNPYSSIPYTLLNLVPNKERYLHMLDIHQQF